MKKPVILLLLLFLVQISFGQSAIQKAQPKKEFRIAMQGGYSYRIASVAENTPPALKDYVNDLRSGYSFGLDAAYFVQPAHGFGLKYSRYSSKASLPNMRFSFIDGSVSYGTISDDIAINFIGPSYLSQFPLSNPAHVFFGGLSLGYMGYNDNSVVGSHNLNIKGATLGAALDLGYDYAISKYITLGAQASLTGGTLSKLTMDYGTSKETVELDEQNLESLSRLDLSAGLRFKI